MTFVSVAQAAHRLGIDAKTLRRWLAEAQLALHRHPHDGRKKGLSTEALHLLAQQHQRHLTPLPQESPAPGADARPAWGEALLSLPEQLDAVQAQLAALQQQVSELTRLLQQQRPAPAILAASTQQAQSARRPSQPASPAPRSRPAAKPPRTPLPVIPRVEWTGEGHYVVLCPTQGLLPFAPDTPEWFAWLAEQSAFRFVGQAGSFSAHHEGRVPRGAWRAHRHIRNHGYHLRLAPTQDLTSAVLEQAAATLQAHLS